MPIAGLTVSGVVLLVDQHLGYFCDNLIPNLKTFTRPFDELIVVCSGLSGRAVARVGKGLLELPAGWNSRIVRVPLGSVGANRNRGVEQSVGDLVSFLDADDLYSADYCQFIVDAFTLSPYDVLLHSYVPIGPGHLGLPLFDPIGNLREAEQFVSGDFVVGQPGEWEGNPSALAATNIVLANSITTPPIHQGHLTMSRVLKNRFHENPLARNEDGVFLQALLADGGTLHFYPLRLSAYRTGSSANPLSFRVRRSISKLGQRFRQLDSRA